MASVVGAGREFESGPAQDAIRYRRDREVDIDELELEPTTGDVEDMTESGQRSSENEEGQDAREGQQLRRSMSGVFRNV
jgi:hypothetical protein